MSHTGALTDTSILDRTPDINNPETSLGRSPEASLERPSTSPSPIPDPKIIDPGTLDYWQRMYKAFLQHLKDLVDHGHAQLAYLQIPQLMGITQNYTTNSLNIIVADKSNIVSVLNKYLNRIQQDFDHYAADGSEKDPSYAADAEDAKNQIERILNDKKYAPYIKDIKGDVEKQLDAIFNVPKDKKDLATWWASLWKVPSPSTGSKDPYPGTAPVSNAINAMRSSLESESTVLNSQMEAYSKLASQVLAFMQVCYRTSMDVMKHFVSATQNAAN